MNRVAHFCWLLPLSLIACVADSPAPRTPQPSSPSATASAASQSPASATPSPPPESFQEFAAASVALQATYRQDPQDRSTPLPIKDYPLPRGVKLSEIQIEKVMLDGMIVPNENLRLSLDPAGNLVFLLKEAQELLSEPSDLPDITQSPVFKARQQDLQKHFLESAPTSAQSVPQVPKPAFLQSRVRGEQLTRQQVATLSSGASALAKEGIFLDRQFSVILAVRNQTFVVAQQRARYLLLDFNLRATTLQQLLTQTAVQGRLATLPLIATSQQKDLLTEVNSVDDGLERIEQQIQAKILSFALGPELFSGKAKVTTYRDFEISLPDDLWQSLLTRFPGRSQENAIAPPSLDTLLENARQQAAELQQQAQQLGKNQIDDNTLYNNTSEPAFTAPIQHVDPEQLQDQSPSCSSTRFSTQAEGC